MLKFEKPEYKVKEYIRNNFYGKFEIEPLERGFGTTLGNALRRVMLSSLPGDAVTSIKIDGVAHEFQKIDGVIEDVTAIVLNVKSLVLKNHSDDYTKVLRLSKSGAGVVTAADIEQDADIVMFLHREVPKKQEGEDTTRVVRSAKTELIIAKNRQGITDSCNLIFKGAQSVFVSEGSLEKKKQGEK